MADHQGVVIYTMAGQVGEAPKSGQLSDRPQPAKQSLPTCTRSDGDRPRAVTG